MEFTMKKILFLLLSICAIGNGSEYEIIQDKAKIPILSPTFSEMKSKKIRLPNGLEAYLISDPKATKSGATLTMKVGSWSDPVEYPGIAHFLEHMLFMGNEAYPDESDYHRYISQNGGLANAFTSNDTTSYLFTIENQAFKGALDRFANFFKTPLFNPSGVERELNAIDQEYAKNLDNDDIRMIFVLKALTNPEHPNYRFNMGNSDTLQKVSQDTLKQWYRDHYSANLMKLVVESTLPLDEMTEMVVQKFGDIPNRNREESMFEISTRNEIAQGNYIFIDPIKNTRSVSLIWNLPGKFSDLFDRKPEDLICFVLGDEGPNSLHMQLKKENLAEQVKCGGARFGPNLMTLYLEVDLTQKGLDEVDLVVERCYQAIAKMQQNGIPEYLFKDLKQLATIRYQYQGRDNEFMSLMKHARGITEGSIETYPEHTHIVQKYDPAVIQEALDFLTPENALVMITSPKQKTDQTEPWLGVKYRLEPIPGNVLKRWENVAVHPEIGLPNPNPFVPENLELVNGTTEQIERLIPQPDQTMETGRGKVYLIRDQMFGVPKISWHFYIRTPQVQEGDSSSVVLGDLYTMNIKDMLNQFVYPASVAELNFGIERKENGIAFTITGYHDKAYDLLHQILEALKNPKITNEQFNIFKESLLRKYQNFAKESSLKIAAEKFRTVLYKNYTTEKEKASAIRKITLKKYQQFSDNLFDQTYLEGLMYGNQTENDGKKVFDAFTSTFTGSVYPVDQHLRKEVMVLPDENGPFYIETKSEAQGNTAILAIESTPYSFKKRAVQQILMQGLKEPFFSTLRTKQQTGYIVLSYPEEIERKLFSLFAVQSNSHDPRDLLSRYELFLEEFLRDMPREFLTREQFENIKQSVVSDLEKPAKNVHQMGELLYQLAFDYDADFDWIQKRLDSVENLSYEDFSKIASELIGRENRRRIAILLKGEVTNGSQLKYDRISSPRLRKMSHYE